MQVEENLVGLLKAEHSQMLSTDINKDWCYHLGTLWTNTSQRKKCCSNLKKCIASCSACAKTLEILLILWSNLKFSTHLLHKNNEWELDHIRNFTITVSSSYQNYKPKFHFITTLSTHSCPKSSNNVCLKCEMFWYLI